MLGYHLRYQLTLLTLLAAAEESVRFGELGGASLSAVPPPTMSTCQPDCAQAFGMCSGRQARGFTRARHTRSALSMGAARSGSHSTTLRNLSYVSVPMRSPPRLLGRGAGTSRLSSPTAAARCCAFRFCGRRPRTAVTSLRVASKAMTTRTASGVGKKRRSLSCFMRIGVDSPEHPSPGEVKHADGCRRFLRITAFQALSNSDRPARSTATRFSPRVYRHAHAWRGQLGPSYVSTAHTRERG